jgi:ubiquinone biosynthesis protein COQ9
MRPVSSPSSIKLSYISSITTHARDLPSNVKETTTFVEVQITGCKVV